MVDLEGLWIVRPFVGDDVDVPLTFSLALDRSGMSRRLIDTGAIPFLSYQTTSVYL